MLPVAGKGAAGGAALACTYEPRLEGFILLFRDAPDIHLIAGDAFFGIGFLEYKPFPIEAEIGFGIVAAKGQLTEVAEVRLFWVC